MSSSIQQRDIYAARISAQAPDVERFRTHYAQEPVSAVLQLANCTIIVHRERKVSEAPESWARVYETQLSNGRRTPRMGAIECLGSLVRFLPGAAHHVEFEAPEPRQLPSVLRITNGTLDIQDIVPLNPSSLPASYAHFMQTATLPTGQERPDVLWSFPGIELALRQHQDEAVFVGGVVLQRIDV